jgi:hypothetical protein
MIRRLAVPQLRRVTVKKLLVCIAATACLVGVGTAAAYITPPAPPNYSLTLCYQGRTIGSNDAPSNPTIHAGDTVRLRIGWGTLTEAQSLNFLDAQNGLPGITIHQGSPTGPVVSTATWQTGDASGWTAPTEVTNPGTNGGKPFWLTNTFRTMGSFSAGNYYVDADLKITKTLFDGTTTYPASEKKPASWISISGCPMTVSA